MNIDQIIQCDIVISESMTIEGGYDSTLIVGPLPANASDHTTPDVSVYSNTDELKDAGFTVDDPVYIAVQKYFSQSPRPKEVYVAVQKQPSGATEGVDVTLDRANATSGWYAVCPAGIAEDIFTFLQGGDSIIGRLLEDAGVDVDELRENIHNFFEDAKAFGGEALDALRQFWEEHGQAVVGVLQWLWGVAVALIQVVLGLFHGVLDDSSEAWNDFLTGLDNLGAAVFGSLWDPMKESAQALWDWLTGFFDWIGDRVEQIRGAWTAVKNFFTGGSSEDEQDTDKTDSTKTRSSKWGGAGRSKSSDTDSKKAVSGFVSAGQAASSKTVNAPVSRSTKNITVRQENNQKYTFQVSDRQAADKLQREVSTQGTQSANQLAHTLNFGG